ncbi:hypothetical protein [Phytoactinopolyspora mesophila]|uniref:Prepilin peptidase n=1 Tax=Phytoactinopolyspora mesophila TaxID=2650750 RepID=A0A7K3M5C0_9ACTN|nr:hypothetical protein [Phytoactinopolyspora mesophila]NDL58410.1 hypothetical protein [Phytoactinopolyspora mesophila]
MPSARYSFIAALLAGVLTLASASSTALMAGGIALIQVVFAMGVVRASNMRSARPAAWLALAGGLGTLIWVEFNGTPELAPMAVVLGPTVLVAFVVQLLRRDGRPGLNSALALVVTSCVLATLPVAWLALRLTPDGTAVVALALLGVAAAALAEVLPISRAIRRVLGVLLASIAAAVLVVVVGPVGDAVPAVSAVVISAFAGVMAAVTSAIADRLAGEVSAGEAPALVSVPEEVTVPDLASAQGGEASSIDVEAPERATVEPRAVAALSVIVPLRVAGPFVAAAPTAYVLGRLLVG